MPVSHISIFFILFLTAKAETFGKQAHAGIRGQGGITGPLGLEKEVHGDLLSGKVSSPVNSQFHPKPTQQMPPTHPFQKLNQELSPSCIFYLCATTWQHEYLTFTPSTQNSMILFGNFLSLNVFVFAVLPFSVTVNCSLK